MNMLLRRVGVHVRRDAAQRLSNGRVLYDALFTRIGYQKYPRADGSISIEYRPPSEVFHPASLASLANLPGVVLHPAANFGTKFDGRYPVKGTTGERIVEHTDHIHTAGPLCVWDDDWNADIESGDIAQLSCGYELTPGPGGVGPDGRRYDLMHTNIIGDHMAGVPLGRAGSARVVLDGVPRVTRDALAAIASARMDARPFYHDLGLDRWPDFRPKNKDTMKKITIKLDGKDVAIEVADNATPEQIAAAVSKAHADAAEKRDAATKSEHDKALADAVAKAKADAMAPPFGKGKKPEDEDEDAKKKDAARKAEMDKIRADADTRVDVLSTAKAVHGVAYDAGGKTIEQIRLDVIETVAGRTQQDGAALRKDLEATPAAERAGAIGYAYRQALRALDALPTHADELLGQIRGRFDEEHKRDDSKTREPGPITKTRSDAEAEAALPRHERAAARKAG